MVENASLSLKDNIGKTTPGSLRGTSQKSRTDEPFEKIMAKVAKASGQGVEERIASVKTDDGQTVKAPPLLPAQEPFNVTPDSPSPPKRGTQIRSEANSRPSLQSASVDDAVAPARPDDLKKTADQDEQDLAPLIELLEIGRPHGADPESVKSGEPEKSQRDDIRQSKSDRQDASAALKEPPFMGHWLEGARVAPASQSETGKEDREPADRLSRFALADIEDASLESPAGISSRPPDHRDHEEPILRLESFSLVQSRQYPGLAPENNAAVLAFAIGEDMARSGASQTIEGLGGNISTVVNTLKLDMHPDNLGPMTASMRLKGEELSVSVMVQTMDAYRQLNADHEGLVKALQSQGFTIDQVTIQIVPQMTTVERPDASGQFGGQSGGQSQHSENAFDGRQRPRDDHQGGQGGQGGQEGPDRHSVTKSLLRGDAGEPVAVQPSQLYL